jgi:GMP synthase (glutamine-hydrolysing)
MNIHSFLHVPHEGLGTIEDWIAERNHTLTKTLLFSSTQFPDLSAIDWLIIMGGPMSVNDEKDLPWLVQEKQFIKTAIDAGKTVIGFCLGAQLIANVLGARVYKNEHKEIGWSKLSITDQGLSSVAFSHFPDMLEVFQWHGETFDIPASSVCAATNNACKNQALLYGKNVLGLQFHLEVGIKDAKDWLKNGANEINPGQYVQNAEQMLADEWKFENMKKYLFLLLDNLVKR